MAKLSQIIAIEKGVKSRVYSEISNLHKANQKPELFNGFSKVYDKKDVEGEDLPPERQRVQFSAPEVLRFVERMMTDHMQVTARKDWTNCNAKADVVVDGHAVLEGAPVTYLLFLEKQLNDLKTFVEAMPVLDGAFTWTKDANDGLYKTGEVRTHRTKKVQKPIVLYDATTEHPAQTQLITDDVLVGHWATVKHSGALPKTDKDALLGRIVKLSDAVKQAREGANSVDEAATPEVGGAVFGYLFT